VVEFGDAWMPIEGRFPVDDKWVELQQSATAAGRDPATLQLGVFGAKPDAAHLAHLRDIGASFVALGLPALDRDAALAALELYAPLVTEFNG
ncbi:MAG: LLM class F420-dependent oxidoreductase, partial [Ilumatobacteraceae bacterium]|nr:LLM class F420-dependent oxidoreductase [Ilumatobacteraceae bacterium]